MCTLLCVCPPRVESLFPPVLSKSCNQIPLSFKVWFSRNSSSHCRTPRFGSLTWGSELSLQWVDFCGISVLQFVSHPPSGYGIWFYCDCAPPTVSLWLLLCLWMWGIFFGEFQCLPVDDCSAVSCDSGARARGIERTSYSVILNLQRSYICGKVSYAHLNLVRSSCSHQGKKILQKSVWKWLHRTHSRDLQLLTLLPLLQMHPTDAVGYPRRLPSPATANLHIRQIFPREEGEKVATCPPRELPWIEASMASYRWFIPREGVALLRPI